MSYAELRAFMRFPSRTPRLAPPHLQAVHREMSDDGTLTIACLGTKNGIR